MGTVETGYWAAPNGERTRVHITDERRPVCSPSIEPRGEFQWCATSAVRRLVECKRCLAWLDRQQATGAVDPRTFR